MKLIKRWKNDRESIEHLLVTKVRKEDALLLEQLGYVFAERNGKMEVWNRLLYASIDLGFASVVCTPLVEDNGEKELHIGLYRKAEDPEGSKFYSLVSVCNHGTKEDARFLQEDGLVDVLVWGPPENRTDFDCYVMDPNWDGEDAEESNAEPIPEELEQQQEAQERPQEEAEPIQAEPDIPQLEEAEDASVFSPSQDSDK